MVDQMAGVQVLVDLVTATQVHANRVAGTELLLNHCTPGDGYEFTHQVSGVFPFEGWKVCLL